MSMEEKPYRIKFVYIFFTTAVPSGFAQQHQIHASCVQTVPNLNPSRL